MFWLIDRYMTVEGQTYCGVSCAADVFLIPILQINKKISLKLLIFSYPLFQTFVWVLKRTCLMQTVLLCIPMFLIGKQENMFLIKHSYLEACNTPILQNIRIYHDCEGRIEKSVPRITVWHHEACRVISNGDCEADFSIPPSHE